MASSMSFRGSCLLAASCVLACSAGKPASVASKAPTHASADAIGEARCGSVASAASAEPLLVDWPSTSRAKLEALAHKSLVVVRYEACTLEVLGNCKAKGSYLYTAITHKHDQMKIEDDRNMCAHVQLGTDNL